MAMHTYFTQNAKFESNLLDKELWDGPSLYELLRRKTVFKDEGERVKAIIVGGWSYEGTTLRNS